MAELTTGHGAAIGTPASIRYPPWLTRLLVRRAWVALLVFLPCCSIAGPGSPLDGVWFGRDGVRRLYLSLRETDGSIGGGGHIDSPSARVLLGANSSRSGRQVLIGVAFDRDGLLSFGEISGVLSGDTIRATLTGLAFNSSTMTLRRLP